MARTASTIGIGIPNFWLGMLLVTAFALNLKWFPAVGFRGITVGDRHVVAVPAAPGHRARRGEHRGDHPADAQRGARGAQP